MQIYGPYRVSTAQQTSGPQRNQQASGQDSPARPTATPTDQLDLSAGANSAAGAGSVNRLSTPSPVAGNGEIRIDRVADIRRQIADGSYETPEKLDAALDRLLDQLA